MINMQCERELLDQVNRLQRELGRTAGELAKKFNVSTQAMAYRLARLGILSDPDDIGMGGR